MVWRCEQSGNICIRRQLGQSVESLRAPKKFPPEGRFGSGHSNPPKICALRAERVGRSGFPTQKFSPPFGREVGRSGRSDPKSSLALWAAGRSVGFSVPKIFAALRAAGSVGRVQPSRKWRNFQKWVGRLSAENPFITSHSHLHTDNLVGTHLTHPCPASYMSVPELGRPMPKARPGKTPGDGRADRTDGYVSKLAKTRNPRRG